MPVGFVSTRLGAFAVAGLLAAAPVNAGHHAWQDDLTPIAPEDWSYDRAAHLIERAGFGATPAEIEALAAMTPDEVVRWLVNYESVPNGDLPAFDHSGIFEPGLDPFPPSRPATTALARANGEALGVRVKPDGNRRLQPVVNKFFYWLRASMLETRRIGYWWGNRMLATERPLEEKMTLFWHGHFATIESKVRDYRKMLLQNATLRQHATGNFGELLLAVARDPAMLAFLDAGVNVAGAPNENFAREIMEIFSMGVGNYSETDIREAARAFTGWYFDDLTFVVNTDQHDRGSKTVLGQSGNFDGADVVRIILEQPITAEYISARLYRFFVREELSPDLNAKLAAILRDADYELKPLLRAIFLSRDFYSAVSVGTHIKSPVELVISSYRKLGLRSLPGIPDFNESTAVLGQALFWPPTVAGWAGGRSWVTPGLLLERGNFARRVLFPDIDFVPHDIYAPDGLIREVHRRTIAGADITSATMPPVADAGGMMAESNMMADRDEDFNTRYASYRGWQMAIERVKPIPRTAAVLDLAGMVRDEGLTTTTEVVDHMLVRLLRVPLGAAERDMLIAFLDGELGTSDIARADRYLEDGLRMLVHLIMSQPEYQLG
ncbi:MAG: DUF1800 domain-containing protein [Alphaproteobacteria bacterium]|nr:DUF1800 domain-containing protein [Alphaproteobacteria bacterium]